MSLRRSLSVATIALGLAGCSAEPEPITDGRYDPEVGNLFEGPMVLSDQRVLDMDGAQLPATPAACDTPHLVVITNIRDGDTFDAVRVEDGADIGLRMIGVDTPETEKRDETGEITQPLECYANEAMAFTELLRGRYVWITYDAECQDAFGRDLAYVWVRPGPGDMWNRQLVRRGFARTLTIEPNSSYAALLEMDRTLASSEGLGLRSECE